jgi:2,5-diketo-D-gluconate reductase B
MLHVTVQGRRVPSLGFGTWQLSGSSCRKAVSDALRIGYRHLDTAQGYANEREVGEGLRDAGVDREEVFLVTKISPGDFAYKRLLKAADESLRRLNTDYLDLLLLHWPNPSVPLEETLEAMLELKQGGKIRFIGVSNFPPSLTKEALAQVTLFCNQVEYHPFLAQDRLLAMASEHDFMLTAYSPLAKGQVHRDETLKDIGRKYGKTAAQIALRWLVEQDKVAAIPKAASHEHRLSNFDIFDFELSPEDKRRIDALDKGRRLVNPSGAPDWED